MCIYQVLLVWCGRLQEVDEPGHHPLLLSVVLWVPLLRRLVSLVLDERKEELEESLRLWGGEGREVTQVYKNPPPPPPLRYGPRQQMR